ncbi:putative ribonuclease H-like domain-containing protein [Tanacetum coccineum]|uniref:Ribonuclease H-like domain-containing protein n=1 Tax=Tanacetum coccineum TaxID=301880 RepID=A0ABQ5D190_9ASTR
MSDEESTDRHMQSLAFVKLVGRTSHKWTGVDTRTTGLVYELGSGVYICLILSINDETVYRLLLSISQSLVVEEEVTLLRLNMIVKFNESDGGDSLFRAGLWESGKDDTDVLFVETQDQSDRGSNTHGWDTPSFVSAWTTHLEYGHYSLGRDWCGVDKEELACARGDTQCRDMELSVLLLVIHNRETDVGKKRTLVGTTRQCVRDVLEHWSGSLLSRSSLSKREIDEREKELHSLGIQGRTSWVGRCDIDMWSSMMGGRTHLTQGSQSGNEGDVPCGVNEDVRLHTEVRNTEGSMGIVSTTLRDRTNIRVPPPYTGNFMPPTPNLSFTGLDEFVNEPVVENSKAMSSKEETKYQGVIDSGCSRHMTGNMSYLTDYEEIDGGYVTFGGNPKGGKITRKGKAAQSLLYISKGFCITKASDNAGQARKKTETVKDYIFLPLWTANLPYSQDPKSFHNDGSKPSSDDEKNVDEDPRKESKCNDQEKEDNVNSTNNVNAAGINKVNIVGGKTSIELPFDPNMPVLEDYSISDFSRDEDDGAVVDMNNLDTIIQVSPIPTTRIHKDHPLINDKICISTQIKMSKNLEEHGFIEAMQEELLQFKLQEVWTLVDLPNEKRAIGSKWVFRNKKDERGIVIRNKARLVAQGYTQEEGTDYDEVFVPVIEEEVYVCQPPRFEYPDFPDKVTRLKKHSMDYIKLPELGMKPCQHIYWIMSFKEGKLTRPYSSKGTKFYGELTFILGLQVKQKKDGIFISHDKYVDEILKKFRFTEVKTANTPMETQKPLLKDEDGEEVDVYIYRLMIGSLMYLTSLRPDIMYLKGQPKLGLLYPKYSPFDLVAYTDSDYARASLDRKSTTGDCQFLGCRIKYHAVQRNRQWLQIPQQMLTM